MGLSIRDQLKRFVPNCIYYPQKIAREMRHGEPELGILRDLVPAGCTAIDVGANRGAYSYALAKLAGQVEAFEPNRDLARFVRRKLGRRVRVHEVALADREGTETFFIPQLAPGSEHHIAGNLGNVYPSLPSTRFPVRVVTLDSFAFENVGFIKIDVEGHELPVIKGAIHTIARWRPNLVVELLVNWQNVFAMIDSIASTLNYEPLVVIDGQRFEARRMLDTIRPLVTSRNVLFMPKHGSPESNSLLQQADIIPAVA